MAMLVMTVVMVVMVVMRTIWDCRAKCRLHMSAQLSLLNHLAAN